mgnify:CR=1 FL=1
MKLSYRGQAYEAQSPTVATTTTQYEGLFRGQHYTMTQSSAASPQLAARLRYRGVDYTK